MNYESLKMMIIADLVKTGIIPDSLMKKVLKMPAEEVVARWRKAGHQ